MIIQKIKINNFKSIYGELELNFQDIQGFWKISGSVGAGKTTIGEAIIFGLFGSVQGKNNSDLISWGQKSSMVEVWAQSKGQSIYIQRKNNLHGQSPLYVEVDGEVMVFTNKRDAQLQLEQEYFDVSRLTLELLCIISFNNFKSLATLNTQDTKKFLDQVFGFYVLTNYSDICKEFKTESSYSLQRLNSKYTDNQAQVEHIKQIINSHKIEGDISLIKQEIDSLTNEYKLKADDLKVKAKDKQDEINNLKATVQSLVTLGKKISKELSQIESGICPLCGAQIDKSYLTDKKAEQDTMRKSYAELNANLQAKTLEYTKIFNELDNYTREYKNSLKSKETLLIQLQEQEKQKSVNDSMLDELQSKVDEIKNQIPDAEKDLHEWDILYNLLSNDIRNKVILSFIPALNKSIANYTQQLHLPYIITFDNNFKCNIKLFGMNQEVAVSSLSTGQLKTVDISIILGVLNVIMNSVNFNICFLDELFSNMDAELRNIMCNVLKNNLKPNQSLFIISHVELDDKFFNGEIEAKLEYRNDILKGSIYNIKYNN